MISCSAHGMCAELLPERVSLDDWGYPVIDAAPLDPELVGLARIAVQSCPKLALRLQREPARAPARARR
ncbi:ferredoxin [Conexibacter sp. DBS9H8]|uniref:ferredoxin n=1 Tax=Conexibacter sp. DBS9H8 TaxID=2937801 RepID=UPI00200E1467|nr:ferredoxin [Conexibacter sp. DBS9H8]